MSDEALADPVARDAAIMEHRRRTGWMRPVILAPREVTVAEWIADLLRTGRGGLP